jgi:hypothetical protein
MYSTGDVASGRLIPTTGRRRAHRRAHRARSHRGRNHADRQPSARQHHQPLAELTRHALLAWLRHRGAAWPRTINRHVLISRISALGTGPVSAACYLDLGDFRAPTTADGGYLIHLLSDQQWCRHWLLHLDSAGNEAVATSTQPIGFDLPDDWPPLPQPVPTDGSTVNLEVCVDSFAEFLYRFWIENEIWYALHEGRASTQEAASYAAQPPLLADRRHSSDAATGRQADGHQEPTLIMVTRSPMATSFR